MPKYEVKICEKCTATFECQVGDTCSCQGSKVVMSAATIQFLEQTDFDCLCENCLTLLNQKWVALEKETFPDSHNLRENFHYYMENGFWVFTENYHFLRGYCCRSGCRHCVYGFKKEV